MLLYFQALLINKFKNKITTRDNGNAQSHDQDESKLNNTINGNSGTHKFTHD